MSHFIAVVVTDKPSDVDDVLAPFDENLDVDPHPVVEWTAATAAANARDWYLSHPHFAPAAIWEHPMPAAGDGVTLELDLSWSRRDYPDTDSAFPSLARTRTAIAWSNRADAVTFLNNIPDEILAVAYHAGDYSNVRVEDGNVVYDSTRNPAAQWDWWTVGGRWRGFFTLKPADAAPGTLATTSDSPALGQPGTPEYVRLRDGEPQEDYTGRADQVQWKDVDLPAMAEKARVTAEDEYDRFEAATAGLTPPPWSFSGLVDSILTAAGLPTEWTDYYAATEAARDAEGAASQESGTKNGQLWRKPWDDALTGARTVWHDDPWVRALRESDLDSFMGDTLEEWCVHSGGRGEYVRRAVDRVGVPYALVVDGQWISKGEMGWFGMSRDEVTEGEWNRKVQEFYAGLDGEVWVTAVDLHI